MERPRCIWVRLLMQILLLCFASLQNLNFAVVNCDLVHLNPRYPLQPPSFPLTATPHLWPTPQEWITSQHRYRVPATISIRTSRKLRTCDIIRYNVNKYSAILREYIRLHTISMKSAEDDEIPDLKEIYLFIEQTNCSSNFYPSFTNGPVDQESYSIEVQATNAKVVLWAPTIWGAVRALETLSQLVYADQKSVGTSGSECHHSAVYLNVSRIQDAPRFRYRGIMIDTARHFLPVKLIIKNLDAMSYSKFNILHWHLNDDQSFPFASKVYTNFSRLAAFSRHHIYRYRDIETIIEEARLRAIQVILEIDTPGHGLALGKVFPDLLTPCGPPGLRANRRQPSAASSDSHGLDNTVDASKEVTYQTMRTLVTELVGLFPSPLIHLGMDDVNYDCWNGNPTIKSFMSSKRMHRTSALEEYYAKRLISIATDLNRKCIVWQDPLDNGVTLPADTIIQVWKDSRLIADYAPWRKYMSKVVQQNYTTILSACWFLSLIRYGQDWRELYNCEPMDFDAGVDEETKKRLVLGGEACMWGEYVDGSNFMSRLWPRAAAVGERLWSQAPVPAHSSLNDVQYRLDAHRCRLLSRGIDAAPLQTSFCPHFDWNTSTRSRDEALRDSMDEVPISDEADFSEPVSEDSLVHRNQQQQTRQVDLVMPHFQSSKRSANSIGFVSGCTTTDSPTMENTTVEEVQHENILVVANNQLKNSTNETTTEEVPPHSSVEEVAEKEVGPASSLDRSKSSISLNWNTDDWLGLGDEENAAGAKRISLGQWWNILAVVAVVFGYLNY